ncbi:histidinol dehydrogenase [Vibrio lentus]|nr:histidinol dehydrogenase [Vibrio lentus]
MNWYRFVCWSTETLVIADEEGCDPELATADLLSRAEHGYNSPAVLCRRTVKHLQRQ